MGGSISGRGPELAVVDDALARVGDGFRLLMIGGPPGIGKTTVLQAAIEHAREAGFRVLACRSVQAETRMSFTNLGDMLASVEAVELEPLPAPQRHALEVALLRAEPTSAPATQRAIGAAILSLLQALSTEAPVIVALDDAQWLDRGTARALGFALRRLETSAVAALVTVRTGQDASAPPVFVDLPAERVCRLDLGPLEPDDLYGVLDDELGRALTAPLLKSIARVCGGNPFYALEIARALVAQGRPESGQALPVPNDLRQLAAARVRRLPPMTRDALLKVSALSQPSISLVDPAELGPAVSAGVLSIDPRGRIEFVHPLYGAAVYADARSERRRSIHRELASCVTNLEEQARHLALSTDGPDERIAATLEAAADLAHRRGAPDAAAELAEQAAHRTPTTAAQRRSERMLRAARHHFRAGDHQRAQALAQTVLADAPSSHLRAETLYLLAEARTTSEPHAASALLEQALLHAGDDAVLRIRLETGLGMIAGAIADGAGVERHLDRAVELAEVAGDAALMAEALALRAVLGLTFGRGLDETALERALELEDPDHEVAFQLRPMLNVAQAYEFAGRPDLALPLLAVLRDRIVARGEESDLPLVLEHLAANGWLIGSLEQAERDASDGIRAASLAGQEMLRAGTLMIRAMVRAIRGELEAARGDAADALDISERIGWPWGINQARYDLAFIALCEDDMEQAVKIIEPVIAAVEAFGVYEWPIAMAVPDAVEALIATNDRATAARLIEGLSAWGRTFDRPWALALSARGRAVLEAADGRLGRARAAAEEALVAHQRLPMPFELARTLLVLGRVQRRQGHRRAARESLLRAGAVFEQVGAVAWVRTARAEAQRIGIRHAPTSLTEREQLVAELAAGGLTNREIAARLFISSRTVEANLSRAYRKLGVTSRVGLAAMMARRAHD